MSKVKEDILFTCDCGDLQHQMVISYIPEDSGIVDNIYVSVLLKKLPWYKRIIAGIQYIFGKQSKFGYFDEIILQNEDVDKLEKIVGLMKKGIRNEG